MLEKLDNWLRLRQQKPIVIQFPVNDICNAHCQMCHIWQQKIDYQITPDDLKRALSNPLFKKVRAVGVNGGEPTLRKDLAALVTVLYETLPSLQSIALITNGLKSEQAIERIGQVGEVVRRYNGALDVMVSLDGVGSVHDRVRGRQGNFENAVKVLDFITTSDLVHGRRLGCTVIRENVFGVHDLLDFAISKNIYIKYRIGVPHQRLYTDMLVEPFALSLAETYHFAVFLENLIQHYEKSPMQNYLYKSIVGQLMYNKPRKAGCDWKHRGVTLSARGELLYCAVKSPILGSAITENSQELYFGNKIALNSIIANHCDGCMHDYMGIPPLRDAVVLKMRQLYQIPSIKALSQETYQRLKGIRDYLKKPAVISVSPSQKWKSAVAAKKILICGWYGTETLGDKAILGGIILALKNVLADVEVYITSLEPYISDMTKMQMPELSETVNVAISDAPAMVSKMDLVIFGGGPLMAIQPIVSMEELFTESVLHQIPTLVAGCGVGPLGNDIYNRYVKSLIQKSTHCIFRDHKSLEIASSLGVDTQNIVVAEDPAWTWLQNAIPKVNFTPADELGEYSVLLGLRDWPFREYAPELSLANGMKMTEQFNRNMAQALEKVAVQFPALRIVPFPMCTNHIGGDDRWFYHQFFRTYPELNPFVDNRFLYQELSPVDNLKAFLGAKCAVTMRFHSLVFSIACGLPTVAVDYTLGKGKVGSLAKKQGITQFSLTDVQADAVAEEISRLLRKTKLNTPTTTTLQFTNAVEAFLRQL